MSTNCSIVLKGDRSSSLIERLELPFADSVVGMNEGSINRRYGGSIQLKEHKCYSINKTGVCHSTL